MHRGVDNLISLVSLQAPRTSNHISYSPGCSPEANSGHGGSYIDFRHRIIETTLIVHIPI